ncbi:arylsulfatase B-like [Glandiceps talaboti]
MAARDPENGKSSEKVSFGRILLFIVPLLLFLAAVVVLAIISIKDRKEDTPGADIDNVITEPVKVTTEPVKVTTEPVKVTKRPHIIYMMPDDLGYNDVGWHDATVKTPYLSELAHKGVKLSNFYTMSACSPSRAALMTGRYSSNIGGQHYTYLGDYPHGVPTYYDLLPKRLKDMGYATYGVGKWHMGFCNSSFMPTNRGFDHFFGFLNGGVLFYEHTNSEKGPGYPGKYLGIDLHDDLEPASGEGIDDVYTSDLFEDKMKQYIRGHDPSVPMYLYVAYQQPHGPRVVPGQWSELYPHIQNEHRRITSGQLSLMDEMAGNVFNELKRAGMYDDSLIIFHADNGGHVNSGASNWPFRGNKGTFFEGGIKGVGFIAGNGIEKTGYTHDGLFHITDMLPTIVEGVLGGTVEGDLDGMNVWDSFSKGEPSPRREMLITVDQDLSHLSGTLGCNVTAIRYDEWKLMVGFPSFSYAWGEFGWYPTRYLEGGHNDIMIPAPEPEGTDVYLFNLKEDPYETNNLADKYPGKVEELRERLKKFQDKAWTYWPEPDPASDPANFGGFWETGWCNI